MEALAESLKRIIDARDQDELRIGFCDAITVAPCATARPRDHTGLIMGEDCFAPPVPRAPRMVGNMLFDPAWVCDLTPLFLRNALQKVELLRGKVPSHVLEHIRAYVALPPWGIELLHPFELLLL